MTAGRRASRRSIVLAAALAIGLASPALADRAFTSRFSTNANGDIALVGNTLETCQSSVADCAECARRSGHPAQQQLLLDGAGQRRVRVAGLLVRSPELACGRAGAVRGPVLRCPHDRGNGREGRARPVGGGCEQGRAQAPGRLRLRTADGRGGSELGGHGRLRGVRRRHGARCSAPVPASIRSRTSSRRRARTDMPAGRWWSPTRRPASRPATSPCSMACSRSRRASRR